MEDREYRRTYRGYVRSRDEMPKLEIKNKYEQSYFSLFFSNACAPIAPAKIPPTVPSAPPPISCPKNPPTPAPTAAAPIAFLVERERE